MMCENIRWYPVSDDVLMEGAVRGAHLKTYYGNQMLETSICCVCGGLTLDYIKDNPKKNYNSNSVVCICDYGKIKDTETSRRNMAIYLSYFVGELRKNRKNKNSTFLPKIEHKVCNNNFASKKSAFKSFDKIITHKKIGDCIEKKMINILIGKLFYNYN